MAITIGLTGGIGSGKSTVAGLLAECGAEIVEGDLLGRDAIDLQPEVQRKIAEKFGQVMFDSHGNLDRRALGEAVFTDTSLVRWLTDLTFPYIHEQWLRAVNNCRKPVIVFDAALIFEWGIQHEFDKVVVVTADNELIAVRAIQGRFNPEIVEQRLRYQIPIEQKIAHADIKIDNSGSLEALKANVESLYQSWVCQ